MGAVLEKIVEVEIFGNFCRISGFAAVIFSGLGKDIGDGTVVIEGKIKGAVGVSAADVD